jgi:hypothetical protein
MQYTSKTTSGQLGIAGSNNYITYTCTIDDCIVGNAHGDAVGLVVDEPQPVGHYMRSGTHVCDPIHVGIARQRSSKANACRESLLGCLGRGQRGGYSISLDLSLACLGCGIGLLVLLGDGSLGVLTACGVLVVKLVQLRDL